MSDNATKIQGDTMKSFLIVEDNTSQDIWDRVIVGAPMNTLPSKPRGWNRAENTQPQGDWTFSLAFHQMVTEKACRDFGVTKPPFEDLPAVFCVDDDGTVHSETNVTADQVLQFIKAHLQA